VKYKGQGKILNIKKGFGKIKLFKVQVGSILRLTQPVIINKIISSRVFGGHFGMQSPNFKGNYENCIWS